MLRFPPEERTPSFVVTTQRQAVMLVSQMLLQVDLPLITPNLEALVAVVGGRLQHWRSGDGGRWHVLLILKR